MEVISIARIGWYLLGSALIGYAALHVLGRRAGSTAEERRLRMPGDELVPQPHILTNHVIRREKFGAEIDWTWSFRLTELPGGRTRLQLRVRGRTAPRWLTATYLASIIPADYVMSGGMLRGIKRRAESGAVLRSSGRSPLEDTNTAA